MIPFVSTVKAQQPWETFPDAASQLTMSKYLDNPSQFKLIQSEIDAVGTTHNRYAVLLNGIKAEGIHILTHQKPNGILDVQGSFLEGNAVIPSKMLTFNSALDLAKKLIGDKVFYWEDPHMENLVKRIKDDAHASYYPKEELVYLDPDFSTDASKYRLCYRIELYYHGPMDHKTMYIDAVSGEVVLQLESCVSVSREGSANTRYSGTQKIVTDSTSDGIFILVDESRGKGIETLNARNYEKQDSAVNFEDDDNIWEDYDAATNAHWAMGQTYDYFLKEHNRKSYDNKDSRIVEYIHHDTAWFNATWNGSFARFGDGKDNPLTNIDVVAHELTHGVTGNSSKLIYRNESGALNESFSDIFGNTVEFYSLPDSASWNIGIRNFQLRSMSNPNSYGHPDTYKGQLWYEGVQDNGGVHLNSGVQNFWFYLLCNGGSGKNDLGNEYQVDSLGLTKASQIAYANLVYYLGPNSNYFDARNGAIEAAKNLFGVCSPEVKTVAEAWYAVGVGSKEVSADFEALQTTAPKGGCDLGKSETVRMNFVYGGSGCDSLLAKGEKVTLAYQLNSMVPVREEFTFPRDLLGKDSFSYSFNTKIDLSEIAVYSLKTWVEYPKDFFKINDTSDVITFAHTGRFGQDDSIVFEPSQWAKEKLLYLPLTRSNSLLEIDVRARNGGIRGITMSGILDGRFRDVKLPENEADNFKTHTDQIAQLCMCVDARNWADPMIKFDLKQTYSAIYATFLDTVKQNMITSLRVTVNGEQVGTQYHPKTPFSDPFQTHYVDLKKFAGTEMYVCLEGKHFANKNTFSAEAIGDNSYLDNINVYHKEFLQTPEQFDFKLHPNPSNGLLTYKSYQTEKRNVAIVVWDAIGKLVLEDEVQLQFGQNSGIIDMRFLRPGLYHVRLESGEDTVYQTLMIF
jgi:Zn-dependent metalloprotease